MFKLLQFRLEILSRGRVVMTAEISLLSTKLLGLENSSRERRRTNTKHRQEGGALPNEPGIILGEALPPCPPLPSLWRLGGCRGQTGGHG